ncbi:MAG: hypothetical protein PF508_20190 [Spirochaeta sp.]|jgi:hypothetical protein|nr:hypothetical protein [Spirochaeta sp.]
MRRFTPAPRGRVFVGITIGVLALLFAGCTEGERGIFATIAIEEEIKKNNLVENASVTGLVLTEVNGTEYYVSLAGTKIFARPAAGNDWDEIRAPGSRLAQFVAGRDDSANPGAGDQRGIADEVYAVYQGSSSQANILYRLTDSLSWEAAYVPSAADGFIDGMIGVENLLLASTDSGQLLVWNTAVSSTPTNRITSGFRDGIRDGVRRNPDNSGASEVYIIGKSGLLVEVDNIAVDGGETVTEFTTTDSSPQPVGIGVAPYDGGILAVTDKDGSIYVTSSSTPTTGTWTRGGGVGRPASDIVWVAELNNNSGGFLVSTTSDAVRNEGGRGYFEGTLTRNGVNDYSIAFTNELGNNYEASDLAVASINQFRYYGNGVVFALTGGLGLWSTVYPATSDPTWQWE